MLEEILNNYKLSYKQLITLLYDIANITKSDINNIVDILDSIEDENF